MHVAAHALAQVPPYLSYSGFLEDNGTAVTGTVTALFEVFDAGSGGTAIWSEAHNAVAVLDGEFVVELGNSGSQLSSTLFNGRELWLQVTINGDVLSPRIALNSVPYAFYAATVGRVDWASLVSVPSGLSDGDQDTKPGAACNANQFLRWDGSAYSCSAPAESDPQVGDQVAGRWCTSDGTHINCTETVPTATETDPQVGSLTSGRWCTSDGSSVNCTQTAPLTAEADPKVGEVTNGRWCRGNGTQVVCDVPASSCTTKTMSYATCATGTEHMRVVQCTCTSGYMGGGSYQCVNGAWSLISGQSSCTRESCFTAGSRVTMADGQQVPIEQVTIGSQLRSAFGRVNKVIAYDRPVLWPYKKQSLVSINDGPWHMTDNHPVLTRQGWKAIAPLSAELEARDLLVGQVGQLRVGDVLLGGDGSEQLIRSLQVSKPLEPIKLYNFVLDGDHTFIVDNVAVMAFVPDAAGCLVAENEHAQLEATVAMTLAACEGFCAPQNAD